MATRSLDAGAEHGTRARGPAYKWTALINTTLGVLMVTHQRRRSC